MEDSIGEYSIVYNNRNLTERPAFLEEEEAYNHHH